jgi:hypothetical protein
MVWRNKSPGLFRFFYAQANGKFGEYEPRKAGCWCKLLRQHKEKE